MTQAEEALQALDREALKQLMEQALRQAGTLTLGLLPQSVVGATVSLMPREEGLAPKDLPVDTLLHKITMMRDKLRTAEQRINASDTLSSAQQFELQASVTEAYRALGALGALLQLPPDAAGGGE